MKHVTFGAKSFLLDDETALTLMEYAAAVAAAAQAETIEMSALGADGDTIIVQLLLSAGAPLVIESASAELPMPDNAGVLTRMKTSLDRRIRSNPIQPEVTGGDASYDEFDLH